MAYRIAGIDVHKKKLAVVVADVEVDDEYQFERRWFGSNPEQLQRLAEWLIEQRVEEVVMESTAQYWKPLWSALERYWKPSCQNREGAPGKCREHSIWRKHCPTADDAGARKTFRTRNVW
jgi:transposase